MGIIKMPRAQQGDRAHMGRVSYAAFPAEPKTNPRRDPSTAECLSRTAAATSSRRQPHTLPISEAEPAPGMGVTFIVRVLSIRDRIQSERHRTSACGLTDERIGGQILSEMSPSSP